MWRHPETRRLLIGLLLLFAAAGAGAEPGVLGGELGRWLDDEVLPELARELGEHPRFKGEKIRLVSLSNGRPTDSSTRLHRAVQGHLTQRLLRDSQARIAWSESSRPVSACVVAEPVAYLLGVEVERDGTRNHKVNIGVIDVLESEWVSGISHTWRGRLTRSERIAFSQAVDAPPTGSVARPMPVAATRDIARQLHEQLRCTHPEGLDGAVFLAPADNPALGGIVAALRAELTTAPIAALSADEADAEWKLSLVTQDQGRGGSGQLGLLLTRLKDRHSQFVATLHVEGIHDPARGTAIARADGPELLSPLYLTEGPARGICADLDDGERCAEVGFELLEDAYLFVLSTRDRELSAANCTSQPASQQAGERRFRVRVPGTSGPLPGAGLYAIAVTDRTAARALARHIHSGVCSAPLAWPERWLDDLDALLAREGGTVEWQAIHLGADAGRVERL